MNVEHRLKNIVKSIKELREDKIRKTEQLKILRSERDKLKSELESYGLTVKELPNAIEKLQNEINSTIENLEEKLNGYK